MTDPQAPFRSLSTEDFYHLLDEASKPWYRYGRHSVSTLIARTRNRYRWGFRLRMAWQRAHRGYGEDDLWSLNYALAKLVVAGTSYMLEHGHGHPIGMEPEEWDGTLEVIRIGFQDWLDNDGSMDIGSIEQTRFENAMANLSLYFGSLWD